MNLDPCLPDGRVAYPYQVNAAREVLLRRKAILAFDVGLGKTITSILVGKSYQSQTNGKMVVIAPVSTIDNWRREIANNIEVDLYPASKIPSNIDGRYFLTVDECHYFQNIASKRTKAVLDLTRKADGCLLMSATPMRNYPSNLFPLLQAVGHRLAQDYSTYKYLYCEDKESGASMLDDLFRLTNTSLILGTKGQHLDLPPFKRLHIPVEMRGSAKEQFQQTLKTLKKKYFERLYKGEVSGNGFHMVIINALRMATSTAKAHCAIPLAKEIVRRSGNVALFTTFRQTTDILESALRGYGTSVVRGDTPQKKRQSIIDQFQSGENKVFIGSIKAAGAGINLQAAHVAIMVDRTWSPWDMIQCEGRLHRNGQKRKVYSIWLQDKVIDPWLDTKLMYKYRITTQAITGQASNLKGVGTADEWARDLSSIVFRYGG